MPSGTIHFLISLYFLHAGEHSVHVFNQNSHMLHAEPPHKENESFDAGGGGAGSGQACSMHVKVTVKNALSA